MMGVEEAAAIGHRERLARYSECAARRVVGRDDEEPTVAQEWPTTTVAQCFQRESRPLGTRGDQRTPAVVVEVLTS